MRNLPLTFINKFLREHSIHLLWLIFLLSLTYSFLLANKRYENFEYGKFDLGNMSQIVWNTSQGRFMEVTDQFGTNMPRWGMSHVDPVLVIFAPVYKIFAHPMILVFAQHILVLSAIFPLFLLVKRKIGNLFIGFLIVATYILYPANGFTLVWTGFHGVSFVAPMLIWAIWWLEKNNFLKESKVFSKESIVYWLFVILMLSGKEEIGSILALGSMFLYFKNKKLAINTFVVSSIWFIIAFFIIIPAHADLRQSSITTFTEEYSLRDVNVEAAAGENFFFQRYSYLGDSYLEMIKTAITRPDLVLEVSFSKDKIDALNNLFGPLSYVVILSPFWLISIPDLAVVLLSKEAIFDISNHRIAFVISSLFISYVYMLSHIKTRKYRFEKIITTGLAILVFLSTIFFAEKTHNPLYISGKGFFTDKVVGKIFAKDVSNKAENDSQIGETRKSKVPRNNVACLNQIVDLLDKYNPDVYTGPDYLGAHSSLRRVNALYPSMAKESGFVVVDLFETKTVNALESTGWTFNKNALRHFLKENNFKHLYSCGKVVAFVPGDNKDSSGYQDEIKTQTYYELSTNKIELHIFGFNIPQSIDRKESALLEVFVSKRKGEFADKTTFWTFENIKDPDNRFSFINYVSTGFNESLDEAPLGKLVGEKYYPMLPESLPNGPYKVYYGVGDLLDAREIYLGVMNIR